MQHYNNEITQPNFPSSNCKAPSGLIYVQIEKTTVYKNNGLDDMHIWLERHDLNMRPLPPQGDLNVLYPLHIVY